MSKELFNNNKIVESLCQFTFQPIQDNTIFGQYWDLLKKGNTYSKKENLQAVSFTSVGNDNNFAPALSSAMRFSNSDGDKLIQLHNNNISIHQVRKYIKWEDFKVNIDTAINDFNLVTNKSVIDRIDLRVINVFDFPTMDFNLNDYFNVTTSLPANLSNASTDMTLECPLERPDTFLVLRIKTTIQEKINVVLDLSFVCINVNVDSDNKQNVNEILQLGHSELHSLFLSVITNKTKDIIK